MGDTWIQHSSPTINDCHETKSNLIWTSMEIYLLSNSWKSQYNQNVPIGLEIRRQSENYLGGCRCLEGLNCLTGRLTGWRFSWPRLSRPWTSRRISFVWISTSFTMLRPKLSKNEFLKKEKLDAKCKILIYQFSVFRKEYYPGSIFGEGKAMLKGREEWRDV